MNKIFNYFKTKKKEKAQKKELSSVTKGFIALFFFIIFPEFQALPFMLIKLDPAKMSMTFIYMYSALFQLSMAMVLIYIFKDKLLKDFKDLKKNHKDYFLKNIKIWLLGLVGMFISNLIIQAIMNGNLAENEQIIRSTFADSPIYIFVLAVIVAPISEELVFRQGIRNIFKTDFLFIIASGFVFGFIHVYSHVEVFIDFIYIIPYMSLGCAFAYMITKTKNIFTTIGFHALHNGILVGLQTIILISELF